MKKMLIFFLMLLSLNALAELACDLKTGISDGVRVMRFNSGEVTHSKMAMIDVTPDALFEEMISLQEMGICKEKIYSKKCKLKLIRSNKENRIAFIRNEEQWAFWPVQQKKQAQNFMRALIRIGFCS